MCENDAAMDAWFEALNNLALQNRLHTTEAQRQYRMGYTTGVIRELAATVPGVREWLIEHMPGDA